MANLETLVSTLRDLERGGLLSDLPADQVAAWLRKRLLLRR